VRSVYTLQGMFGLTWPGSFPFDRLVGSEVIDRPSSLCGMRYRKFVAAGDTFVSWFRRGSRRGSF